MAIRTKHIDYKQAVKLLQSQEDHFLDFKAKEISPNKISKSIAAFANADGGDLYIGIDEDDEKKAFKWRGFEKVEEANSLIQVFEKLFPLGQDFSYEFLSFSNRGYVLHIEVHKTRDIKVASDNKVYIRRGAQNLPQTSDEELNRLRRNKGLISFESETVSCDLSVIKESTNLIDFLTEVVPTASSPEDWLKKQQLIYENKPTVCGVLLFAEEPQAIIPKRCGIKIYRYKTADLEGSRDTLAFDPVTIEGCVYKQIYDSLAKTVEFIQEIPKLTNGELEKIMYPDETLHEIITNAVLHRDYIIADDIHIRIFDNRIEIESPGTLPGHITTENILKERFARNGNLVRIINKFPKPPNKDVGEGLNTAFQAMEKLRLKKPVIQQRPNSVQVTIPHESLDSPAEIIMAYLSEEKGRTITKSKALQICCISKDSQISRILKSLVRQDVIELVPDLKGSASAYRKKQLRD
jgi:ATP-dependent DNA helicase RecG